MEANALEDVARIFEPVAGSRGRNAVHRLVDLFKIAILAATRGAGGWGRVSVVRAIEAQMAGDVLELPGGILSPDVFTRVLGRLDPREMEKCFVAWTGRLGHGGKLIAIDDKAIRQSFEHAWGKSGMAHLGSRRSIAGSRPARWYGTTRWSSANWRLRKRSLTAAGTTCWG